MKHPNPHQIYINYLHENIWKNNFRLKKEISPKIRYKQFQRILT